MTDETTPDVSEIVTTTPEMDEGVTTIEDTKTQLADMYLSFLDQKKEGIVGTASGLGVNLNPLKKDAIDYLISDTPVIEKSDILSNLGKNIKKKFMEKITGGTFLEYDKASLSKMKSLIMQNKNNQAKLQELMQQIQSGIDPTIGAVVATTAVAVSNHENAPIASESVEEITDRRKAIVTNINAIFEQDKKIHIKYNRGGHTSIKEGLDCGGLLVYTSAQAGLKIEDNGRELFQKFPSKKLEVDADGKLTTDVSQFQEGDVLIFDSLDPAYYDTTENRGRQHEITGTDGQKIHPHHFAFIKSFDRTRGIIHIVESNGSQGVTESECSIADRLDKNKKKEKISNLRAVHVNYDELEKLSETALANLEDLPNAKRATA